MDLWGVVVSWVTQRRNLYSCDFSEIAGTVDGRAK